MPGAIYQLNVVGKQDLFLTGDPQINFMKQIYNRHVNFAIEPEELLFDTKVDFGQIIEVEIKRTADFVNKVYFNFKLPPLIPASGTYAGWTNSVGYAIIDYIEIYIGGILIDKHYGLFLEIWRELTVSQTNSSNTNILTGKVDNIGLLESNALYESNYSVPLEFWFCSDISLSLPLVCLFSHKVVIKIKLNEFSKCIVYDGVTPPNIVSIKDPLLLTDYIYMDDSEKIKYVNNENTYLITQIQASEAEEVLISSIHKSHLTFSKPCSEILFVLRNRVSEENNDWFNFCQRNLVPFTKVEPIISSAKLVLDGQSRTDYQDEFTLRLINSNRYHTNTVSKHIYIMSFSDSPEKIWAPSGTLNFSLVDSAELFLKLNNGVNESRLYAFARNFNILKIKKNSFTILF